MGAGQASDKIHVSQQADALTRKVSMRFCLMIPRMVAPFATFFRDRYFFEAPVSEILVRTFFTDVNFVLNGLKDAVLVPIMDEPWFHFNHATTNARKWQTDEVRDF